MRRLFKLFLSPSVFTTESMGIRKINGGFSREGTARFLRGKGSTWEKFFLSKSKGEKLLDALDAR